MQLKQGEVSKDCIVKQQRAPGLQNVLPTFVDLSPSQWCSANTGWGFHFQDPRSEVSTNSIILQYVEF